MEGGAGLIGGHTAVVPAVPLRERGQVQGGLHVVQGRHVLAHTVP